MDWFWWAKWIVANFVVSGEVYLTYRLFRIL